MCGEVLSFSPCSREEWEKVGRKRGNLVGYLVCLKFRMRNATVKFSESPVFLKRFPASRRRKKKLFPAGLIDEHSSC
jgi:hypothetical protein